MEQYACGQTGAQGGRGTGGGMFDSKGAVVGVGVFKYSSPHLHFRWTCLCQRVNTVIFPPLFLFMASNFTEKPSGRSCN